MRYDHLFNLKTSPYNMEYILLSMVLCYFLLKATAPQSERSRKLDNELARLERELKLTEDPDYWKEAHRIKGWDDDLIYNKFNVHIFTEIGAGSQRRQEDEWKIMLKVQQEEMKLLYPDLFNKNKEQK